MHADLSASPTLHESTALGVVDDGCGGGDARDDDDKDDEEEDAADRWMTTTAAGHSSVCDRWTCSGAGCRGVSGHDLEQSTNTNVLT